LNGWFQFVKLVMSLNTNNGTAIAKKNLGVAVSSLGEKKGSVFTFDRKKMIATSSAYTLNLGRDVAEKKLLLGCLFFISQSFGYKIK
jgi:hypothetical protein